MFLQGVATIKYHTSLWLLVVWDNQEEAPNKKKEQDNGFLIGKNIYVIPRSKKCEERTAEDEE